MERTEFLVIGAGPGGLQLGYYLAKAGLDYMILESGERPGTFFQTMPRHRKLLSINKVHTGSNDPRFNLRYDWNSLLSDDFDPLFTSYSKRYFPDADDLVRYLCDYAAHFNLNIRYSVRVVSVSKQGSGFRVVLDNGAEIGCAHLIVATGSATLRIPDIEGIEYAEPYTDVSVDPDDFIDQRVLIIGKGNSAFETAENLIETAVSIHIVSPESLKLAWKSHFPGDLRAVNNNFLDTYLLKAQNGLLEAHVEKIERVKCGKLRVSMAFTRAHGARGSYEYDRIILCTGFRFDDSFFDSSCKPSLVYGDRFPAMTSAWESVNVPDLYFAGVLMQARDYKKTQSSFIHGFRFNVKALFHILMVRYCDCPWPFQNVMFEESELCKILLERMNYGADLWHQPGFLCDVFQIQSSGEPGRYFSGVPSDYVRDGHLGRLSDYLTLSLEYGPDSPDVPFEFNRFTTAAEAHLNHQLHPIVRRYRFGEQVAEHHVLEDLEGFWTEKDIIQPLREFVTDQVRKSEPARV